MSDAAAIADLHVSTWREAYAHLLPEEYFSAEYIASSLWDIGGAAPVLRFHQGTAVRPTEQ